MNIKQYRNEHHIVQEYIADKLCMHQTTYSRLERNEKACARHLNRIAEALGTTPDVLQEYHLTEAITPEIELPESAKILLAEKDVLLENQQLEITFLKRYTTYLHTVWHEYCGGGTAMSRKRL